MAKIYLDSGDNFTLSSTASVNGSTGTEKVVVNSGVTGADINANVERVDLAGASSAYTYQQVGNFLKVYSGTTLVATVYPQDDTDGTQLVFSNGSVSLKISTAGITLGGATVPSAAAAAVTPTTIDATVTSGSGSSTGGSNGTYTLASDMDTVVEGKTATFTVTRSGDVTAAKTLTFNASGDTNNTTVAAAAAGVDASPASGTVTFAAGATTATFTVSAAADTAVEGLEGLRVRLFDGTTAVADKVVLINDDTTGTSVPGNTSTLTNGVDNVAGTAGDDTILAGAQAGSPTLNVGDNIDGGAGTDTLKIYDGLANFGVATLKNVEIVEVSTTAAVATAGINVSGNAGVKEVWLNVASTGAATATKDQIIGIGDDNRGAAAVATFNDAAGSADAATIAVKDAGKTTAYTSIAVANIENLTVTASGKSALGTLSADKLETLTFKGDGSVTAIVGTTTTLKSVDATANTGGVTLTVGTAVSSGAADITFKGGAGKDSLIFSDAIAKKVTADLGEGDNTLTITQGAAALVTGSTFKAGSGSDTLVLATTTSAVDATSGKMFTGFENIKLSGTSSFKVGNIAGITGFELAAGTGSFTNLADATNVKISGSNVATLTLADNSDATSSVKITLDNGAAGKAAAAGVTGSVNTNAHVLNIESKGNVTAAAHNSITLAAQADSLAQITNIKISGDQAFDLVTATASALTLIDGSTATGALNIDAALATKSMTIKTGEGKDIIKASQVNDVLSTITGGKGSDTITLSTAAATQSNGDKLVLTGQADSTATGFDIVSNFTAAATADDKIDLKAFALTGAQADIFTLAAGKVTVANSGATATFTITDAQAKDFFASSGADLGVAVYANTTTEAYVFIDADKNGDWNAATDSVILLVGDYKAAATALVAADNFIFA
mgnify:CR=1 FL=1